MLVLPLLLLSSICGFAFSQAGKTATDCTIGSIWTETFIRSQCFQGKGVKGVRAIGCVPTNTEKGAMIKPGAIFNEKYFTYSCSKSGEIVSYKIINCRDTAGKNLAVNENRTMADGSKLRCYKDKAGAIKMAQETSDGCFYDGVKYAVGKIWTEPMEFKAKIAGAMKLIGKAVRMECKKVGAKFIGVFAGCVLPSGKALYAGKFHTENKINVKCLISSNGTVSMSVVDDKDITCTINKVDVKNGDKYTTPDGKDVYVCIFGILKKISCIIDGKTYGADTLVTINNKFIYCNKAPGYVDFGSLAGCTLPDGTIKPFYSNWVVGTEVHRCYFNIKRNVVTAYGAFWRCSFNGQAIPKFTVATDGKTYFKKCVSLGKTYGMRDLTAAEIAAYLNARKKGGSKSEFGGEGGEAGGETIAEEPSDSEPQPSGTKPQPSESKPQPSGSKPQPSGSKPQPSGSKPQPSGSKQQPSGSITQLSGSITQLSGSIPQPSGSEPQPSGSELDIENSLPIIPSGKCKDLFELCSSLAPICTKPSTSAASSELTLTEIVKKTKVTVEQIKEVFQLMGFDSAEASNEKEEINEVIRGLIDIDSSEGEDCIGKTKNKRRPSCKKSDIFKNKVHELVDMICPATCKSCNAVGKLKSIIEDLVHFYTSDCR